MSDVAIMLFTLGMVLFTLDTGVPTGTLVCKCCLPSVCCSCMSPVAIALFTLGIVLFTLDTVFLQEGLCVSVVYLGYGVPV